MLNALKWMNVKERIQMNKLQFIQKKKKKKQMKTGDGL